MDRLKLIALDREDIEVVSAHLQDAVVKAFFSKPVRGVDRSSFTLVDSRGRKVPASVDQIGDGTWALFPDRVFLSGGETYTARLAAGSPSAGNMGELDAIAACFIGGTSMRGGSGTVYGALLGALVISSLDNGMSMLDVDSYWQMIVKGSILVLAVWVDVSTRAGRR